MKICRYMYIVAAHLHLWMSCHCCSLRGLAALVKISRVTTHSNCQYTGLEKSIDNISAFSELSVVRQ